MAARASAVTLTLTWPGGLRWVSTDQGCRPVGNSAECRLGDLEPGARAERSLVVIPIRVGDLDAGASVSANEIDLNPIDNVARAVTAVVPTRPGMAVPPIADAGPGSPEYPLGERYRLNGSASLDPNTGEYQQPLRFLWSVIASPANARFGLANRRTAAASFVPPLPGDYTFDLQVSNGNGASHSQVKVHVSGEIRVTAPVAGEVWRLGHPQTITWSTSGIPFTRTLSIFLENADDGKRYLLKSRVRSGKGYYLWKSPKDNRKYLSEQAGIRVCLKKIGGNPPVCGESEGRVAIRE